MWVSTTCVLKAASPSPISSAMKRTVTMWGEKRGAWSVSPRGER